MAPGPRRAAVARFTNSGRPETTFGGKTDGSVSAEAGVPDAGGFLFRIPPDGNSLSGAVAAAVMADGRIVLGGYAQTGLYYSPQLAVIRLRRDGTLDPTFGSGGAVKTEFPGSSYGYIRSVTVRSDGRILVAGHVIPEDTYGGAAAAMRLLPDGSLDPTYGVAGGTILDLTSGGNVSQAIFGPQGDVTFAVPGSFDAAAMMLLHALGDGAPAVTAKIEAGALVITGTAGRDHVVLHRHADGVEIVSLPQRFDPLFSRIEVHGLAGDDVIDCSAAAVPVLVDGGDGNDFVLGGTKSDSLAGGAGDDTLFGGGGDDLLHGDGGKDYLNGGPGTDSLYGDAGNDQLFALDGATDVVDGGAGFDRAKYDSRDRVSDAEGLLQ
jgi:uncharacterized delta-60 repeat protein